MRGDADWLAAVSRGLSTALATLSTKDKAALAEVGLYREKLTAWAQGRHLSHAASVIAAIVKFELSIEVREPGTDIVWVVEVRPEQAQLNLPMD